MAKKKIEMYEGKPVLVAANREKLNEAIAAFEGEIEAPYVVQVKNKIIKYEAFMRESSIGTVLIHSKVIEIGVRAFSCCTNLTSINIPDSVTSIGYGAFRTCI